MFMNVLSTCMCVQTCVPDALKIQNRVSGPPELELQKAVSYQANARN